MKLPRSISRAKPSETRNAAPLLQSPTDEHLGVVFSVFKRDCSDGRVIIHSLLSPDEWTVCLYHDTVLLTIVHDLSLLTERVELTKTRRFWVSQASG